MEPKPCPPPSVPEDFAVTPRVIEATLSWSPAPLCNYTLTVFNGTEILHSDPQTTTPVRLLIFNPASPYSATLLCTIDGVPSSEVSSAFNTSLLLPETPVNITELAQTYTTLSFEWALPVETLFPENVMYYAYARSERHNSVCNVTNTSAVCYGLVSDNIYNLSVSSYYITDANKAPSDEITVISSTVIRPLPVLEAPTGSLSLNEPISVAWVRPAILDDVIAPLTYSLNFTNDKTGVVEETFEIPELSIAANASLFSPNTTYSITVAICRSSVCGSSSSPLVLTTLPLPPARPTMDIVSTDSSITLNWDKMHAENTFSISGWFGKRNNVLPPVTLSGIPAKITVGFKMVAVGSGGESVFEFTAQTMAAPIQMDSFTAVDPANNGADVDINDYFELVFKETTNTIDKPVSEILDCPGMDMTGWNSTWMDAKTFRVFIGSADLSAPIGTYQCNVLQEAGISSTSNVTGLIS